MKLNPECIRNILLTVEDTVTFSKSMHYDNDDHYPLLEIYTAEEVLYHIRQCEYSEMFTKINWVMNPGCIIEDLSPIGHKFIANIREDTNWNKTKDIASKVGSFGLDMLKTISEGVATAYLNKQLNLL